MLKNSLKFFLFSWMFYSASAQGWSLENLGFQGEEFKIEVTFSARKMDDLEKNLTQAVTKIKIIKDNSSLLFRALPENEIGEVTQKLLAISPKRLNSIIQIMEKHPLINVKFVFLCHAIYLSDEGLESAASEVNQTLGFQELWILFYNYRLKEQKQIMLSRK